jgi:hypothetical protein
MLFPQARQLAFLENLAALLASRTNLTPEVTDGITSGPGNDGSQALVFIGQSGTAGARGALPMSLPSIVTG